MYYLFVRFGLIVIMNYGILCSGIIFYFCVGVWSGVCEFGDSWYVVCYKFLSGFFGMVYVVGMFLLI